MRCIVGGIAALHGDELRGWVWIRGFMLACSPSDPVSSTGTGLSFLSHQGRGVLVVGVVLLSAQSFTSGLTSLRSRCVSMCACSAEELRSSSFSSRKRADQVRNDVGIVASSYLAWRCPAVFLNQDLEDFKDLQDYDDALHRWRYCRVSPLPLWIADQARNDVGVVASSYLAASYSAWRCPSM